MLEESLEETDSVEGVSRIEEVDEISDVEDFEDIPYTTPEIKERSKCTRTPGLCLKFPQVTQRSLPPSFSSFIEEEFSDSLTQEIFKEVCITDYLLEDEVYEEELGSSEDEYFHTSKQVSSEIVGEIVEDVVVLGEFAREISSNLVLEFLENVLSIGKSFSHEARNHQAKKSRTSVVHSPGTSSS